MAPTVARSVAWQARARRAGRRERHGARPRCRGARRGARCRRRHIGVLGNGLGVIYPAANRALYDGLGRAGLLLSEFPPGERPHAGSFPRRNRLISGLARATLVVEAAVGSGALITAGTALDQGREVMAVPGPITSPLSVGSNRLIRDGATPAPRAGGLLAHYPELSQPSSAAPTAPPAVGTRCPSSQSPMLEHAVAMLLGARRARRRRSTLQPCGSGRPGAARCWPLCLRSRCCGRGRASRGEAATAGS